MGCSRKYFDGFYSGFSKKDDGCIFISNFCKFFDPSYQIEKLRDLFVCKLYASSRDEFSYFHFRGESLTVVLLVNLEINFFFFVWFCKE